MVTPRRLARPERRAVISAWSVVSLLKRWSVVRCQWSVVDWRPNWRGFLLIYVCVFAGVGGTAFALAADLGRGPAAFAAAQKGLTGADVLPRAVFCHDRRADGFTHAHAAARLQEREALGGDSAFGWGDLAQLLEQAHAELVGLFAHGDLRQFASGADVLGERVVDAVEFKADSQTHFGVCFPFWIVSGAAPARLMIASEHRQFSELVRPLVVFSLSWRHTPLTVQVSFQVNAVCWIRRMRWRYPSASVKISSRSGLLARSSLRSSMVEARSR